MNKLTPTLIFILLLFGIDLQAQTFKVDSSAMLTLRIDPESARGATVSQIFEEVEFIPLETTKESLFGGINQLHLTKNYFIIYDYDTKSILVFKKDGKFHAKINASMIKSEEESKEKNELFGFQINVADGQEQITAYSNKYVFFFNLDGKLSAKKPIKEYFNSNENRKPYMFAGSNHSFKANYLQVKDKDSVYHEIVLFDNDKETSRYFPYAPDRFKHDQFMGSGSSPDGIYASEANFLYIRYYDFNIYKVNPDRLSLAYHLIFPASNSLPLDFMTNESYKNKRTTYFQKNNQVFYGLSDTYKVGNLLFLKMQAWGAERNSKNALIYNLSTAELTSIKDIEPDVLSSYLPVTDAGAFYDYDNKGMHLYRDGSFYTSYSSLAMFTFKDQSAGKNPAYNAVLLNYFKTQTKKSNPVMIRLKPKHTTN